jgi:uncharacterized Zn-finger protein
LPPDFPGGPHRQRAVTYLRFGGIVVSHGGALGLIWGVILGAWTFPISKGVIVAIFNLTACTKWADFIAFVIAAVCSAVLTTTLWALDNMRGDSAMYPSRHPENSQQQKQWGAAARTYLHGELRGILTSNPAAKLLLRPFFPKARKTKPIETSPSKSIVVSPGFGSSSTSSTLSRTVACDGGDGALGHPRVFLRIPDEQVMCPYCSRLYVNVGEHQDLWGRVTPGFASGNSTEAAQAAAARIPQGS